MPTKPVTSHPATQPVAFAMHYQTWELLIITPTCLPPATRLQLALQLDIGKTFRFFNEGVLGA